MSRWSAGLLLAAALAWPHAGSASAGPPVRVIAGLPLVRVPGARHRLSYASDGKAASVRVAPFLLMSRQVTEAELLAFALARPEYQRDRIARVFADDGYLAHWAGPRELGAGVSGEQPATRVSWFAAKAFCESHGLRLPTEAEWELAAAASETRRDARGDAAFRARLLAWYATPNRALPVVPAGPANVYGVHDLHGVVWEWVLDFASGVTGGERGEGARAQLCGGGALRAKDATDYAAFMRFALRASLEADYTTANLGFRCAADVADGKERR